MSNDAVEVEKVGEPDKAGDARGGKAVELIVLGDTSSAGDDLTQGLPNYHVDQFGIIRQIVDEDRAGDVLGIAIYNKRRHNIDRIGISILLQRLDESGYSNDQITSLNGLLADIRARRSLKISALARLIPGADGKQRVRPSLPPAPPVASGIFGAAPLSPEQELWLFLYGESFKPRGVSLKISQALPLHAAKFNLGAPLGPNDATTTVVAEGHTYSVQPFATDLIFYEGTQYAAVRSLNAIFAEGVDEIPATGTGRTLLEAYYNLSITATEKRTGALTHTKVLRPDWRFHLVAKNGHLGSAISDNYIFTADQQYAFQIFGADTFYTPMSDQTLCERLSTTDPAFPAFNALWGETYRFMGVPFDPNSPFHQKALELHIGVPLTGVYSVALGPTTYTVQVWTLDTLYAGPDGQVKRLKDLPKIAEAEAWVPAQPTPIPPTPPNPLPPIVPPSNAGAPIPNDINWPPRPDFHELTDTGGKRESILGRITWARANGDFITITNEFANNIITINIPQLAKIPGGGNGNIQFHKVAANQMIALWAAWEANGLLDRVLSWSGSFVPRTIRNNPRVLSNHAYGTAFDINVPWNGMLKKAALVGEKGSVRELVPLANQFGFYWGGHWNYDGKGGSDGMHFELAVVR